MGRVRKQEKMRKKLELEWLQAPVASIYKEKAQTGLSAKGRKYNPSTKEKIAFKELQGWARVL